MKVYKYRYGSKRDLESLKQDYFYAPHPSQLNDPCENLFDTGGTEQILARLVSTHPSAQILSDNFYALVAQIQEKVGIYSLSKTVLDELLWAYYADSHAGFCIEYDLEQLATLTKFAGSFDVVYQDSIPKIQFDMLVSDDAKGVLETLKLTSGTKSKKWKHEDEIRIIMDNFGKVEYDFRAVKAIYFGLRMPKTQQDLFKGNQMSDAMSKVSQEQVMEVLKGRNIKYYQMALKPNSYEFEYIEILDPYENAEKYKNIVKFIDKSLIDYDGCHWQVDASYFDKVAEIIRRDPYFYKLAGIAISVNDPRSKIEPIIYAHFYKTEEEILPIRKNFTLQEIDDFYEELDLI